MNQSAALSIQAQVVGLEQGASAGLVIGQEASLQNSNAVAVIGQQVTASRVRSVLLLARQVSGDVQTLFDQRAALLFGLGVGGVLGAISLLRSWIRRH